MNAVEFKGVCKSFEGVKVLDDVSFSIRKGEIFAITGPSGTGKSVVLKHIVGLLHPDCGTVERDGSRIGYLFQSGALIQWLTVSENVALPLEETTDLSPKEIAAKVDAALSAVGLSDAAGKYPAEISGGMQKRAGLAREIVRDSDIILFDEPTSGLDPVTAAAIDGLIERLNRQRGITSVVVTHDIASAIEYADRIMLLSNGRVVECSTSEEFASSRVPEVREFLAAMKGAKR